MMSQPPTLPPAAPHRQRTKLLLSLICGGILVFLLAGYLVVHSIIASGITQGPDNLFGDQNLKTAVALLELHKVRYGRYPDTLRDLKFTGQWDKNALLRVSYVPNADRTRYYVEVQVGWVGKPSLQMPAEFWQGTGYSAALKPKGA